MIATTGASVEGARVKSWLEAIPTLAAKDFPLGPALNTQVPSTRGKSKAAITANAREMQAHADCLWQKSCLVNGVQGMSMPRPVGNATFMRRPAVR